jgi:hypothetical protein
MSFTAPTRYSVTIAFAIDPHFQEAGFKLMP